MDDDHCPATTGIPQPGNNCLVTDGPHECMREHETHPLHTCWCGTQWVHSSELADKITPTGPGSGLAWCDMLGNLWRAPFGSPPPGDPMPSEWVAVKRQPGRR